ERLHVASKHASMKAQTSSKQRILELDSESQMDFEARGERKLELLLDAVVALTRDDGAIEERVGVRGVLDLGVREVREFSSRNRTRILERVHFVDAQSGLRVGHVEEAN